MEDKKIKLSGYHTINSEVLKTLTLLYSPIIKSDALYLYTLLISLFENHETSYFELASISGKSIQEISYLKDTLEEYRLIRTFTNKNHSEYYIDIQKPIEGLNFISHNLYSRVLYSKIDESLFKKLQAMYQVKNPFIELEEITKIINLGDEIEQISSFEDKYQNIVEFGIEHQFDYATFIKLSEPYSIPIEFIENKNILHKIGELAYIYDVDVQNMIKLVAKSTKLADKTLDIDKLISLLSKVKIKHTVISDTHMHPLQYLKSKQMGVEPTSKEKQLIQKLMTEYRLNYELINLLIDYSLEKNEQRIVGNYIETVASSWIRKNIKTLEEAKQSLKPKSKVASTRKEKMLKSWEKEATQEVDLSVLDELMKG